MSRCLNATACQHCPDCPDVHCPGRPGTKPAGGAVDWEARTLTAAFAVAAVVVLVILVCGR